MYVSSSWTDFALPRAQVQEAHSGFRNDSRSYDPCAHYGVVDPDGGCVEANFDAEEATACESGYVYDESVFQETLSTKFGLVCGEGYKRNLLGTFLLAGLLLGPLVGGWLGDKLGRKRAQAAAVAVIAPSVLLGAWSPGYEVYAALRIVTATCFPVVWINSAVLILECFGTRHRILVDCLMDLWWPLTVVLRRRHLATTVVTSLAWVLVLVGFYTLALNVTRLSGNFFLNFALAGLAEAPANVILYFTLRRSGRLVNMAGTMWIFGASCLVMGFLSRDYPTAILALYLVGKCSVAGAFAMIFLITLEVYPTNMRSQALSFGFTAGRVLALSGPFLFELSTVWAPLPWVALGVPFLASGLLCLVFLPETFGRPLPQNMDEALELRQKRADAFVTEDN